MNLPLSTERHAFASSVARRQHAQLWWTLRGLVCVAAAYGVGLWLKHRGWATAQFPLTVLHCVLPYLVAANWLYRTANVPVSERGGLLVVTTGIPFLLAPLGFALLQLPYSRGAVLLVYAFSLVWFAWGEWRSRQLHLPRLAYLDPSVPERLQHLLGTSASLAVQLESWPATQTTPDTLAWDGVVVDTHTLVDESRSKWLSQLKLAHIRLYSVEALAEMLSGRKMLPSNDHELWQLDGNPAYDVIKRVLDVGVILLAMPLWLPLCVAVGLAVRWTSPGPILFKQRRVGLNGRPFLLWKFRSMQHQPQDSSNQFAQRNDPRITSIGQFIRRTRLDELPQFWNVLLGDMSLIGPRPEQVAFVESFAARIPAYPYRHLVRPGLTGWAQVRQGYADDEAQSAIKLSYDLYYVAHYSMALDLLIAYKTVRVLLGGFGAR